MTPAARSPRLTTRLLALCLLPLAAHAADPLPAKLGLRQLEAKFGSSAVRQIVEMTGTAGDPQPLAWRVTAIAPGRTDLLREFWIGDNRLSDEGLSDDFYPDRLPKGFLSLERLRFDSTQAFILTEKIAREAGIGFDVINYKLHCREYSDEPVWTLTLLDREDTIVGSVHLSADSGKILRTVWMRRQPNGRLTVQDSARTGRLPNPEPEAEPEAEPEIDPASAPASEEPLEPSEEPQVSTLDETPPPAPIPAPENEDASEEAEIPEIRRLNEAQEKTAPPRP